MAADARAIEIGGDGIQTVRIGGGSPLALIAGPCVIETRDSCLEQARRVDLTHRIERFCVNERCELLAASIRALGPKRADPSASWSWIRCPTGRCCPRLRSGV